MITFKKVNTFFVLIFVFVNIFYVAPSYSLSFREDLFKNALDLSSVGKFNLALEEWNLYLDSYPDDAAGFSNRGNVRLVLGDAEGSIDDQNKSIILNSEYEIRKVLSKDFLFSSAFEIEEAEDGYLLKGRGWGHGVGLCQIGALSMALEKYDHNQILSHYYSNTNIISLYLSLIHISEPTRPY